MAITIWASRQNKSATDYYAGGRSFSGTQNGLAIAGDFMSATTFLGLTGMYFGTGVDPAAIYFLTPLVGLPLMMLLIAGPLRRAGSCRSLWPTWCNSTRRSGANTPPSLCGPIRPNWPCRCGRLPPRSRLPWTSRA